ncbi:MAG TPA: serine hydrolase domain-containing protein, partial [Stellaceae bacterium]|nr:serine hydrolase domain-containing protein [Stellaceae bacterium]
RQEAATALPRAQPEKVGLSRERLQRLGDVLRGKVDSGHVPGAVVLVVRHGKLAALEALGVRDPASGAAMRTSDIFRIYSMTKPIVSVAAMMLWEEGRFLLGDLVTKFLPEFADRKVAVERDGAIELVPAKRDITIQDLLRHTSGLTYEFRGNAAVQKMYMSAKIFRRDQSNAEQAAMLAQMPLMHQPGERWEYSRSTDVLGRIIEVLTGDSLREVLHERILQPLGLVDTDFYVPPEKQERLAEAFARDPDTGAAVQLIEVRDKPSFESGGGGLVSTATDYARFLQMLLNGGTLDGVRLLSRKTVQYMTADHLGAVGGASDLLIPGYGFGLGFAVRKAAGLAPIPGSVGDYYWGGLAGTTFWVDPAEALLAVLLIQAPGQREYYRMLFRDLVYAALAE